MNIEYLVKLHEIIADKYCKLNRLSVEKFGYDNPYFYIKNGYHNSVASRMRELKRILTEKERKELLELATYYFYN